MTDCGERRSFRGCGFDQPQGLRFSCGSGFLRNPEKLLDLEISLETGFGRA
jgi:hypothetical protein